jgi:hypothetical protein
MLIGVIECHCVVHRCGNRLEGGNVVGLLVGPGMGSKPYLPGAVVGNCGPLAPVGKLKVGA